MTMREPETRVLPRQTVDVAAYNTRQAREQDYRTLITAPTIVEDADSGDVVAVYLAPIEERCRALTNALLHIHYTKGTRTKGLRSRSKRDFGYQSRRGGRFDPYCFANTLRSPEDHEADRRLRAFAPVVARYYQRYGLDIYDVHEDQARHVLPEWKLRGGPFTSERVNRDDPIAYHHDGGNLRGVWSGMLGLKCGVTGGYLAVPEYAVGFEIADRSLLFFNGQDLLHGVTPFVKTGVGGYRLTIVYYSQAGMWHCLPPGDELAHAQRRHRS